MLEVVIAVGLLSIGLLGIAAMQINALGQTRTSKQTTEAATIAYTRIEQFNRIPFADPALTATPGGTFIPAQPLSVVFPNWTQGTVQQGVGTQVTENYSIAWRIFDDPAPVVPGWTLGSLSKTIDVRVTWNEVDLGPRQVLFSTVRFNDLATTGF